MRRTYILFLFISIVMGMSSFANASVTVPEVGKVYHLVHNRTGYYLTTNISAQGASISTSAFTLFLKGVGYIRFKKSSRSYTGINAIIGIRDGLRLLPKSGIGPYSSCR